MNTDTTAKPVTHRCEQCGHLADGHLHTPIREDGTVILRLREDNPLLGLATTGQLIHELQARMEVETAGADERKRACLRLDLKDLEVIRKDLETLGLLSYRTVDSE